ncbi:lipoprotein [Spirochaetia bacterium]|nr:lipoprotein [Spirochaetia bacterium]
MRSSTLLCIAGAIFSVSCHLLPSPAAILWTDRPEFALYAEQFNFAQDQYKVEVRYFESPALKLTETGANPDIVAGSWLKSSSTRNLFMPLDEILKKDPEMTESFYPRLLALGFIDDKQYLLPAAFNIKALVFARNQNLELSNPFTIGLEEIEEQGKAYNTLNRGAYSRMGFSPAWSNEFLFTTMVLFNASFRESDAAGQVAWENSSLDEALGYISRWINEANTNIQAEDDFTFKYFYEPPARLVLSGRILFTCFDSSLLFTLTPEVRENLDFRWIARNETIPLDANAVFYGIAKNGRSKKGAEAFTRWFFNLETQRFLLEQSKSKRINESSFGIAGGFSAMRTVTEQVFPQFYPGLLGHIPPESFLSPPNILPRNWESLKERVIFPYLQDRIRLKDAEETRPLERRITEWSRLNRR